MAAYRFWVRIFALAFVLSLAASVPVLFQLGMLWPALMARIGNVTGPMLAYAVVTVFVLKSCFLGVMLFGQRRVSNRTHTLSVLMVAVGLTVLAAWLVAIESWLHVPQGAALADGRYVPHDWLAIVFNPAMPWHLLLLVSGSMLAGAFLVLGVTAWQALHRPLEEGEKSAWRAALVLASVALALQLPAAAGTIRMVAEHQPLLAAAVAGYWHSGQPAGLVLWGWPDAASQSNLAEFALPLAGDAWLGRAPDGAAIGLDRYSGMQPPVAAVFWLARFVWIMTAVMLLAVALCWRRRARREPGAQPAWWLRTLVFLTFSGALAVLAGWLVLELGRQPYAVTGTVTWSEVLGGDLKGVQLAVGAAGQVLLYLALTAVFVRMLFHAARYGVVPVRKAGRHA